MYGPGLEQPADLVQRRGMVAVVLPVYGYIAGRGPIEAEDQPHRRRLAGAVRAEEAGHDAGLDGECQIVDGALIAVHLRQGGSLDHRRTVVDDS